MADIARVGPGLQVFSTEGHAGMELSSLLLIPPRSDMPINALIRGRLASLPDRGH